MRSDRAAKARITRIAYLCDKGWQLIPRVVSRPGLVALGARGVHLASYLSLDLKWIRVAGIETILDIGANAGQFATAIHAVLPEAKIYSFEPLPVCYQKLKHRFAGVPGFEAFEVALGDESSRITFHQNEFTKSSSPLVMAGTHEEAFPWTARTSEIEVDVRTLDSFLPQLDLKEKVLVKIDVQGFEDRVLRGGEQVVRTADYVFVETSFEPLYEGQASFETVYELMTRYGFRYAGNMDQLTSPTDDRILQADALFVRQPA